MRTFFRFVVFFVVLAAGIAGLASYWTLYRPLPDYEATVVVPGMGADVTIHWDTYGVPHIFAADHADAYRAVGYAHAQDRLWQMTLAQRFVDGRFAEILGAEAVPLDRYSRTIGFGRIARGLWEQTSPEQRRFLEAYAEGVNAWIDAHPKDLPIEFALTKSVPLRWEPHHSLGVNRLMAWNLNVSWWPKVMMGFLQETLPDSTWRTLVPGWATGAPTSQDSVLKRFMDTETAFRKLMGNEGTSVGSNAWVVDARRSASGYPILAGDPHLGLEMPGTWYEVHLNVGGRNLAGATIPGAPFVVIGQSDTHAWSITSLMADQADFTRIRLDSLDRGRYQDGAGTTPFELIREQIPISDGSRIPIEIRNTKFGPIINDIYDEGVITTDDPIAFRWTGAEPSHEGETLHNLGWATDFAGVRSQLHRFGSPGINLVYADRAGNIALFTLGYLPQRRDPLRLRDSADPADAWTGFVPFERLPRIINPPSGFIANANNPPVSDYPEYITAFWEPESRIERIVEVLSGADRFSVADFEVLQNDVLSPNARELTPLILPALIAADDSLINQAVPYLRNWDYRFSGTATAATLFEGFFLRLTELRYKPLLGERLYAQFIRLENWPVRLITEEIKAGPRPTLDSLMVVAMRETVRDLRGRFGPETSEWRWEQVHTIHFQPPVFREAARDSNASALLKRLVTHVLSEGPFPAAGHSRTVNNGQYDWNDPYLMVLGASIRRIVDLADPERSRSVLPTGQSGQPMSDHFGDQTGLWLSGQSRIFEHHTSVPGRDGLRTMILTSAIRE